MEIIGQNLVMLREVLGLTQTEVAEKMGVSRQYITKNETAEKTKISRPFLESLCRALNTTEEWLTEGTGWSYNAPTFVYNALCFVNGCAKMNPSSVVIVTYHDGDNESMGFVFTCPNGTLSMSIHDWVGDIATDILTDEIFRMFKSTMVRIGHVTLGKEESKKLIHADMDKLAKQAHYGK